jgi:hypothetical protein
LSTGTQTGFDALAPLPALHLLPHCRRHDDEHLNYRFGLLPEPLIAVLLLQRKTAVRAALLRD